MAAGPQAYGVHILAGSGPVFDGGEVRPVNRASAFSGRTGRCAAGQADPDPVRARGDGSCCPAARCGSSRRALGRIGVLICYDAEFPLLGRALVEAGAEILLVPSCTDALAGLLAGADRCHGARARGPVRVVQAPTVGPALVPDRGPKRWRRGDLWPARSWISRKPVCFPRATMNAPGWVFAEVDRAAHRPCPRRGTGAATSPIGTSSRRLPSAGNRAIPVICA
jgi:hypothetical protein